MTVNKDDRGLTDALNHGPVRGLILVSISTESADRYTWKTVRSTPWSEGTLKSRGKSPVAWLLQPPSGGKKGGKKVPSGLMDRQKLEETRLGLKELRDLLD